MFSRGDGAWVGMAFMSGVLDSAEHKIRLDPEHTTYTLNHLVYVAKGDKLIVTQPHIDAGDPSEPLTMRKIEGL